MHRRSSRGLLAAVGEDALSHGIACLITVAQAPRQWGLHLPGDVRGVSVARRPPLDCLPTQLLSHCSCARSLFRRLFPAALENAFDAKKLTFYGRFEWLCDRRAFHRYLAPARKGELCVYARRPFAGPEQVLV
jgi:hypothetical protein